MQGGKLTLTSTTVLVNFNFGSYMTTLLMNLDSKVAKHFSDYYLFGFGLGDMKIYA